MFVCLRPVESCIPLFADEQVREVDFFKLEIDWLDELSRDEGCGLGSCVTSLVLSRMIAEITIRNPPSSMTVLRSEGPNLTMTESVSP
jgi:hypothetical protein